MGEGDRDDGLAKDAICRRPRAAFSGQRPLRLPCGGRHPTDSGISIQGGLVKADSGCLNENGIALLRPVLKINLSNEPTLNFHVWFHCMPSGNENDHLMVGWRLEAPEGGTSAHDFYHAQPLRLYGPEERAHGLHDRYPVRFPTVPLPASNAVELCLTAILIACGKEALRTFTGSGDALVRAAARAYWAKLFGGGTQAAGLAVIAG
jgi:hypothetical protein